MNSTLQDLAGFTHVRIIISVVTGLSVARLLTGLSRFVQHPDRNKIYLPHLAWVLFMLLFVIHFWWFEFGLSAIPKWQFPQYAFVIGYAALIFFTSSLLFPDQMDGYDGFADYFQSRQSWFYGFLALLFVVDIADSRLKGAAHLTELGTYYQIRQALLFTLALAATRIKAMPFHLSFALLAIVAESWWISRQFYQL